MDFRIGVDTITQVTYYFDGYDITEAWQTNPANMVDGNTGTYGYAHFNHANKIQLCNSNTCSGDILGEITKIEIRARHRDTAVNNILTLRPIFLAGDGDNHILANCVLDCWSSWIDITNDTNAPASLTWNDVEKLCCDVDASVNTPASGIRSHKIEIRVTYNTDSCGSCNTFSITGDTYTVDLKMPQYDSEDNSINKNINRFNFWSEHYDVHDDGINSQPLILTGIEFASCDSEYVGMCFGECARFNLYFNMKFTNKFRFLMEMANNNEEVVISGLGDCMDATYIIKHFSYKTDTPRSRSWTMTLEKVR